MQRSDKSPVAVENLPDQGLQVCRSLRMSAYVSRAQKVQERFLAQIPSIEGVVCYAKATPWPFTFGTVAKDFKVVNWQSRRDITQLCVTPYKSEIEDLGVYSVFQLPWSML